LSIPEIGNFNHCGTSITSFNKNVGYYNTITVLETVKSFRKLVSKDRFPKLKDFVLEMRSTFGNTNMCGSTYIFYDEASEIYSKNRNWMADETMDDSLRLAAV